MNRVNNKIHGCVQEQENRKRLLLLIKREGLLGGRDFENDLPTSFTKR